MGGRPDGRSVLVVDDEPVISMHLEAVLTDSGYHVLHTLIQNATTGAQRAASLTRSLLAFARRQPLEPKPTNVGRLVSNMTELLTRTLGEKVAVRTIGRAGLWQTMVDANQLENTILNLAVNARDAMPSGGQLTIELGNAAFPEEGPPPEGLAPGEYVAIIVSDTGVGMSKEVLASAFEPFFTTKGVGHGTGLGLSQVYGFVRQSGGQVTIESQVGAGSTVRMFLPRLVTPEPGFPAVALPPRPLPRARGECVLVVEDEPSVREHTVSLLAELGYQIVEAKDGSEALAALADAPDIALLFTDIGLPGGMDGRHLAERALRHRPELKVLYTSGYAPDMMARSGALDSGIRLLSKPFALEQLARALRETLGNPPGTPPPATVLVVEDEALIRMDLAMMLTDAGYHVVEVGTGGDARTQLQRAGSAFGAVILDLGLPDMSGEVLAGEIRAGHPEIRIVVLSGAVRVDALRRIPEDGGVKFLGKPCDPNQLLDALAELGIAPSARSRARQAE